MGTLHQGAQLKCIFGCENILKGRPKNVILEGKQVLVVISTGYTSAYNTLEICAKPPPYPRLCSTLNGTFHFSRITSALPFGTQNVIFMSVGMSMYLEYENLRGQSYKTECCPNHKCCFINIKQCSESSLYLKDLSAFEL